MKRDMDSLHSEAQVKRFGESGHHMDCSATCLPVNDAASVPSGD